MRRGSKPLPASGLAFGPIAAVSADALSGNEGDAFLVSHLQGQPNPTPTTRCGSLALKKSSRPANHLNTIAERADGLISRQNGLQLLRFGGWSARRGQNQRELRAPGVRFHLQCAVHQFRQLFRDRQAEATAGCAGAVKAVEALEQLLLLLRRDAAALVLDLQHGVVAARRGSNPHRSSFWRVQKRVLDQDPADLQDT